MKCETAASTTAREPPNDRTETQPRDSMHTSEWPVLRGQRRR
jgi:hypothetical protein